MRAFELAAVSSRGAAPRSGSVESTGCTRAILFVLLRGNNPEIQLRWQGFTNRTTPERGQGLWVRANIPDRAHAVGLRAAFYASALTICSRCTFSSFAVACSFDIFYIISVGFFL